MSCEIHQEQISKLLDNVLDKGKMADVFGHLGDCEDCREFFRTTMHVRQAMAKAAPLPISDLVDGAVLNSFQDSAKHSRLGSPPPGGRRRQSVGASIRTFALAMLVVIIGCLVFSTTIAVDPSQSQRTAPIR
jgi:predicted anti-sigma-YlaC factor YlaD